MGSNPENMIKKAISQTIIDEMFRELGFYVLRLGEEDIVNPLTQLEWFIKKCNGNFNLQKSKENEYNELDYLRKIPDFCIVNNDGDVFFLEVKFSKSNMLNEKQLGVFDFYPETYILIVNLEVGENILFIEGGKEYSKIESNTDNLKNSRFNILYTDPDENDESDIFYVESLKKWLKEDFNIEAEKTIKKYEDLVVKWLKKD